MCRVWRKEIESGAVKCTECGSFQNWRRFLDVSSTIVSLIIALISVTALSAQHLVDIFGLKYSDVRVVVLATDPGSVTVLATNTGNRSGAMRRAALEVEDRAHGTVTYRMVPQNGEYLVQGGESRQVRFMFEPDDSVLERHRRWVSRPLTPMAGDTVGAPCYHVHANLWMDVIQFDALSEVLFPGER